MSEYRGIKIQCLYMKKKKKKKKKKYNNGNNYNINK